MSDRPSFARRVRDASLALALEVALDPSESAEDIAAARRHITAASSDARELVGQLPAELLADIRRALRALLAQQERERLRR